MNAIQEAKGALADAEKALRDLMQQELKFQRYSALAELARMANGLAQLAGQSANDVELKPQFQRTFVSSKPEPTAKSTPHRRRGSKDAYPKFERDDEKLVKIGWSKKLREEYEHRAPRTAVLAFAEHVGAATTKGKTFAIDELLPAHDIAGEELPSYQVYLVMAWFLQAGLIEKKGRDGYVRVVESLDAGAFDVLWDQTPERS